MKIQDQINELADRLYSCYGHIRRPGFDFSSSPHPMERMMYRMAEIAYEFFTGDTPDYNADDDDETEEVGS